MTRIAEVPFAAPPDELYQIEPGSTLLRAPFFDDDCEGGALQVGLQPDEFTREQLQELITTVVEELGRRAMKLARQDGLPFTIRYSDNDLGQPVLDRAVHELTITDTDGIWLGIETADEEPLQVTSPEGLNYLAQVLAMFTLRAANREKARSTGNDA